MRSILFHLVMIMVVSSVASATVYIEPEQLQFHNLLPAETYEKEVTITTDQPVTLSVSIPSSLPVTISPMKRVLSPEYPLTLQVEALGQDSSDVINLCFSHTGTLVSMESEQCVGIPISITTNTQKTTQVTIEDITIYESEPNGKADVAIKASNAGNQDASLTLYINNNELSFTVPALADTTFHIPYQHTLGLGEHAITVNIPRLYNKELIMPVREHLLKHMRIHAVPLEDALVNEPVTASVVVQNTGNCGEDAAVAIEVLYQDEVVFTKEHTLFVGYGAVAEIPFSFTPEQSGTYIITTKAFYADTYTDSSQQFTVVDSAEALGLSFGPFGLLALFLIAFVLMHKRKK